MTEDRSISAIADELIALNDSGSTVAPFSERYPALDAPAGYRAAARLHAARLTRGWKLRGRKIGFTNRTLWPRYGVYEPMWGALYDRPAVFEQGDRATVPLAGLALMLGLLATQRYGGKLARRPAPAAPRVPSRRDSSRARRA